MFRLLAAVYLLAFIATSTPAETYEPCCSTSLDGVGRLLLIPDEDGSDPHPAGSFTVTVRNLVCDPIPNAVVEVLISGQDDGRVRLCQSAVTTKTTNEYGVVEFNISGGGCYRSDEPSSPAVVIRAAGVVIRHFAVVMSPDYAGWDNEGVPDRWSLSIDPIDLGAFVTAYQGGTGPASCHDYNNDGIVSPEDFAVFAAAWAGGTRDCSR